MDERTASNEQYLSVRRTAHMLTRDDKDRLLALCKANEVDLLDEALDKIATEHNTTKAVVILWAIDSIGRNAVHYAAMGDSLDILGYLLNPYLFPDQHSLHMVLFTYQTDRLETPLLYAITDRTHTLFIDNLITALSPHMLSVQANIDGLGQLHCAAINDDADMITHLVTGYALDIDTPVQEAIREGDNQAQIEAGVQGDTPAHLAARLHKTDAFIALHSLGANCTTLANSAGETALDVVHKANAGEIIAYLEETPNNEVVYEEQEESDGELSEIDEEPPAEYVRWLETGEMPHGVCRRDWEKKVRAWRRMAWFMLG